MASDFPELCSCFHCDQSDAGARKHTEDMYSITLDEAPNRTYGNGEFDPSNPMQGSFCPDIMHQVSAFHVTGEIGLTKKTSLKTADLAQPPR